MKKIYRRDTRLCWLHVWFLIISATVAHAQTIQTPTIQWQRLLGTAYRSSDYQPQVVRASSDGFAVLNGKVIRLNDSGNTIWETTLPDLPEYPGYYTNPTHIAATPDGGFGVLVYNQFKWSLARLNSDGTVRWLKSFADNPPRNGLDRLTFTKLIYTVDGGFLAMAISSYPRMGSSTVLYKFDVNGINTLSKGIGFSDEKDPRPSSVGSDVVQIADGNYILVGKTSVSSTYPADWVVKFTNELVVVWQRAKVQTGKGLNSIIVSPYDNKAAIAVGSATGADTRSLTISTNGDIADNVTLANYTNSTSSFLAAGANPGSHTIVDIVNERQGDIRLQTVVGQTLSYLQKLGGSGAETITGVVAGADGGFLIIGATNSTDGDVQGKTDTNASVWLVKVGPVSNSVYSVKSGNWNDPSVWSCNCAPAAWQNVTINGPHTVRLDATMPAAACLNLEIIGTFSMQGSSITINGASVTLDDANVVTN